MPGREEAPCGCFGVVVTGLVGMGGGRGDVGGGGGEGGTTGGEVGCGGGGVDVGGDGKVVGEGWGGLRFAKRIAKGVGMGDEDDAVIREEARLVRKNDCAWLLFSTLTLSVRRFAPRLASPRRSSWLSGTLRTPWNPLSRRR